MCQPLLPGAVLERTATGVDRRVTSDSADDSSPLSPLPLFFFFFFFFFLVLCKRHGSVKNSVKPLFCVFFSCGESAANTSLAVLFCHVSDTLLCAVLKRSLKASMRSNSQHGRPVTQVWIQTGALDK